MFISYIEINMKFVYLILAACLLLGSKTSAQNCENLCISSYDPVCAINPSGVIQRFSNLCLMNLASCTDRTGIMLRLEVFRI